MYSIFSEDNFYKKNQNVPDGKMYETLRKNYHTQSLCSTTRLTANKSLE